MKKLGCFAILVGLVVLGFTVQGRTFYSYISDLSGPKIELKTDQAVFGSTIRIPFEMQDRHPVRLRYHFNDDSAHAREIDVPKSPLELDASGLKDGENVLHLTFVDASMWKNDSSTDFKMQLDLTQPKASLLSPGRIWESRQGDTLLVFVRIDKPVVRAELELVRAEGKAAERVLGAFFEAAPQVWCLLRPIDIETPPGEYTDRFYFYDRAGNEVSVSQRTKVLKRPLRDGEVTLTASILDKIGCKDLDCEEKLRTANAVEIDKITHQFSDERHFRGPFIRPGQGTWTSPYGQNRLYDNKVWHRHLGMDLADVATAPAFASNDGVVVLAKPFGIYGNCVILDHGRGIYTLYGHNSQLKVKAGDKVTKGQEIAIQGDTGLAGGIHLHLSFIVGTVYVAPDIFIQKFENFEGALADALGPDAARPVNPSGEAGAAAPTEVPATPVAETKPS